MKSTSTQRPSHHIQPIHKLSGNVGRRPHCALPNGDASPATPCRGRNCAADSAGKDFRRRHCVSRSDSGMSQLRACDTWPTATTVLHNGPCNSLNLCKHAFANCTDSVGASFCARVWCDRVLHEHKGACHVLAWLRPGVLAACCWARRCSAVAEYQYPALRIRC